MNKSPKKSLGQHWLVDERALDGICKTAGIKPEDTILEIGPGKGALTKRLIGTAKRVVAVELDKSLAKELTATLPSSNLEVINQDILEFDFGFLPYDYKIVANIPYYLSGHLLRLISETPNPPQSATLLVQKEVAERICAKPGGMSILSASVQFYFETQPGQIVPAKSFEPPPKVDSQVVSLKHRRPPLYDIDTKIYFRLVKAGFSGRRKKLRSSLSGGLGITKPQADKLLKESDIDGNLRAQNLSLDDWRLIYDAYAKIRDNRP